MALSDGHPIRSRRMKSQRARRRRGCIAPERVCEGVSWLGGCPWAGFADGYRLRRDVRDEAGVSQGWRAPGKLGLIQSFREDGLDRWRG